MIRYVIDDQALRDAIEAHKAGWSERAREKTREAKIKGRVDEGDGIWSEVKGVFAALQNFKCIYCEKPMPAEEVEGEVTFGKGAVEYDVEHFRPKNRVQFWPGDDLKAARAIDYDAQLSMGEAEGYLRLAFDPTNYALSCKTCNSGHKGDRFPIAGTTNKSFVARAKLDAVERPMLLLPLGDAADDPEEILGWTGPVPTAKKHAGHDKLRARVCIDFFSLDTRTDLLQGRANAIYLVWDALEDRAAATGAEASRLDAKLAGLTADRMYFAACVREFVALYKTNRAAARKLRDLCHDYVISRDRKVFEGA